MIPYPQEEGKRTLVPYFALYGQDKYNPNKKILLVELIEKSGEDPVEYILKNFIFPVIQCFITVLTEHGFYLELHGQNTLFEMDDQGKIHRLVFRDLDLKVDRSTREEKGLSLEGLDECMLLNGPTEHRPFGAEASIKYDRATGILLFDRLAAVMKINYGVEPETLKSRCRAFFLERFPQYHRYFSEKAYFLTGVEIKRNLIEIKEFTPEWRPS